MPKKVEERVWPFRPVSAQINPTVRPAIVAKNIFLFIREGIIEPKKEGDNIFFTRQNLRDLAVALDLYRLGLNIDSVKDMVIYFRFWWRPEFAHIEVLEHHLHFARLKFNKVAIENAINCIVT